MACMPYHPWPTPLAQPAPDTGAAGAAKRPDLLPGSGFVLHPALADCLTFVSGWRAVVLPDGGSPNTSRSHFQAQDVMELGTGAISGNTG